MIDLKVGETVAGRNRGVGGGAVVATIGGV